MKIAFYDTHSFEKETFDLVNQKYHHSIHYIESRLTEVTALLAKNHECVCAFTNDQLSAGTLEILKSGGTKLIALRSAGYNHIDLVQAKKLGLFTKKI